MIFLKSTLNSTFKLEYSLTIYLNILFLYFSLLLYALQDKHVKKFYILELYLISSN